MACTSNNCDPLDPQVLSDCGAELNGSAAQAVVFTCGNLPVDVTDGVEVAALIAGGDAVLFQNLLVELPEGSPVEGSSYIAGGEPKPSTYQRSATWIDSNVNETSGDAYNSINAASGIAVGGLLLKLVEEDVCLYITPNVSGILFKGTMTGSDSEPLRYAYSANWKNKIDPIVVATPAGVFS